MNFNFKLLDEPITIEDSTIFVIEDVRVFANVAKLFYQYDETEELKVFNAKQQPLKSSELMLVTDILGHDINSAATLKLIYADLEQQLNEKPEVKSMIDKLTATISELIGYELLEHELDLEEDEITVIELFKALGIKIETKSDTIFEKLIEIVQVYKYLSKKKLLVFINVCAYLTKEELLELRRYISLYQVKVLFIEPRKTDGFSQVILDSDYFLHVENGV
ncbi:type II-A CRISPR-associated protein Csn2 [Listeria cossartiae]|uniref:type II-A CRISPR-associated protein Csn2 n=1 Tax=Listeria cossartiae TaxID=2838249 RepID=UPI001624171D|nr:type II-A CRISPR-associated protein Csn2 [Listeria cossartiae]MBC1806250.1 type II-A CRISPR-associated protein Csn2 [Listeria cossartiae subsp. cayugensis]MBC1987064.1 type II-A CRISPR-associated protein Csn2 [Listeria cossartiae subsp. cossartiae]MCD2223588.1 type II-A CRISPR-associated protein Csn2 [Listeria cossartiae]MCD2238266.1 type II-A CRISPR-associated protein Csn2 [Listeria cossartiae]MDT0001078.1 type II-A CRISPR-associated protein Csn2 [Listeria cossartiae subsp. cayugensis]